MAYRLTSEEINRIDTSDMWGHVAGMPGQWEQARQWSLPALPDYTEDCNGVCILGMGGSAIGGDLIVAYARDTSPVPVEVVRHYRLPAWVSGRTMVIVSSYSGETEETLEAFEQAVARGSRVVGITSGGTLETRCLEQGYPVVRIPAGLPPRAALAYSFVPLYRIFHHWGLLDERRDGDRVLQEAGDFMAEQNGMLSYFQDNEALNLAEKIDGTLPLIYCGTGLLAPVHLRWRGQLEENAKTLAYGNLFPELNHNEIVGWEQIAHLTGRLSVIMLRDEQDLQRISYRMDITSDLIREQADGIHTLYSRGPNRLARMMSLIQLADWTSLYLALINGVDPTPVTKIDLLKSHLSEV